MGIGFIEKEPGEVSLDFRTRDAQKYDVARLAQALGGGGHSAASGASIKMEFSKAKEKLLQTIKELYPDLGNP